ncbi:MAG: hypothetical protein R2911_11905 [Caldilineaceae bacterium]
MTLQLLQSKLTGLNGRRMLAVLAALLISVGVLGVLIYRERAVLLQYDWRLRWEFVAGAQLLMLLCIMLAGLVWASMMHSLGSHVAFKLHMRYYAISYLARRLPGTLWYVAGRGYMYRQQGESVRLVTAATGLELVVHVLGGSLTTLLCAAYALVTLQRSQWIGLGLVVGLGLLATHPRAINWLLVKIGRQPAPNLSYLRVLSWLAGYVVLYVLGGLMFFWIGNAVMPIALHHFPYVLGSWTLVATLSVLVFFLPSNMGFTEVG